MSNQDKKSLVSSGRARRHFIKHAVLATAGASATVILPSIRAGAAQQMAPACPDANAPMKDVEGRTAFITGGSSGIGLGIARAFADAGMNVVIGYRTKKHLDEAMTCLAKTRGRVHAISVDVNDRQGIEKAAAETERVFGRVHVLVNNAGVNLPIPFKEITYSDWDWVIGVNLTGVFNGLHAFLPYIQAHDDGGQIITTSSLFGLVSAANQCAYSASKYAVVGMMEALRAELVDSNVGVSVFCPGLVTSNVFDSARNRPSNLADTGFEPDEKTKARQHKVRHDPEYAMPALEAGKLVLRSMRRNDLYILTHPEYEQVLRARSDALMASIPRDLRPSETRLAAAHTGFSKSIYAAERDRKLCARESSGKSERDE